jgi:hypothetical protein
MRFDRPPRPAFLPVLGLCLALALVAARPDKARTPAAADGKPLIRKDLLTFGRGKIVPSRRDIFRPADAAAPAKPSGRPAERNRPAPAAEEPGFTLNIVYVGSVRSAGIVLALVVQNGRTITVAAGDEIVPGYRVLRVTADEIEITGPNSERKTFARQGDRP